MVHDSANQGGLQRPSQAEKRDFDELYILHSEDIAKSLERFRLCEADVLDCLHETFLNWRRSATRVHVDDPKKFLLVIARNLALNLIRVRRRRGDVCIDSVPPSVDPNGSPVSQLEQKEKIKKVQDALEQLPEQLRQVIELDDSHTDEEIAEMLGISVDAVKHRLRRARAVLGRMLADLDGRKDAAV
jgi:RNA polymerase sigma-70 factor (ECF subfamily)